MRIGGLIVALALAAGAVPALALDEDRLLEVARDHWAAIAAVFRDELRIEDHYGSSRTSHREDEASQVLFAAGREGEVATTVEFAIPLDSGDPQDRPLERGKTYRVILAYHKSSDSFGVRHTRRAALELVLE